MVNLIRPDCSAEAGVSDATTLLDCSSEDGDILNTFSQAELGAVRCDGRLCYTIATGLQCLVYFAT